MTAEVAFGPAMNLSDRKGAQIVQWLDETLHTMLADLRRNDPVLQQALRRRHAR